MASFLFANTMGISGEEQKSFYFPEEPSSRGRSPRPQKIRASPGSLNVNFKGFRFKDNKSQYRWEEGRNGLPQLSFDSFLPESMTACMRGRILYSRHGDQSYWFSVILKSKKPRVGTFPVHFALYLNSKGWWRVVSQSVRPQPRILLNKEELDEGPVSWPFQNILRKWTHVCVAADFANDKVALFLNGKRVKETEFEFSRGFPENYFSEELRASGDVLSGFSVELCRFLYDFNPCIGELLDINVWD